MRACSWPPRARRPRRGGGHAAGELVPAVGGRDEVARRRGARDGLAAAEPVERELWARRSSRRAGTACGRRRPGRRAAAQGARASDGGDSLYPAAVAPSVTPLAPVGRIPGAAGESGATVFANVPAGFDAAASTSGVAARPARTRGHPQRPRQVGRPSTCSDVAVGRRCAGRARAFRPRPARSRRSRQRARWARRCPAVFSSEPSSVPEPLRASWSASASVPPPPAMPSVAPAPIAISSREHDGSGDGSRRAGVPSSMLTSSAAPAPMPRLSRAGAPGRASARSASGSISSVAARGGDGRRCELQRPNRRGRASRRRRLERAGALEAPDQPAGEHVDLRECR